jgi:excisionase family DNA binding protein
MEHIQKPFTVDDAVAFTGLSKNYLYKLVYLKKIPFYKPLNGKIYFKQEELESFIFRNRQAADYEGE